MLETGFAFHGALPPSLLVGRVAVVGTGRRELSELVAHHVLRDEDRQELAPVVNGDREAHHLREDHGATAPGLDDLAISCRGSGLHLLEKVIVDEGSLFD